MTTSENRMWYKVAKLDEIEQHPKMLYKVALANVDRGRRCKAPPSDCSGWGAALRTSVLRSFRSALRTCIAIIHIGDRNPHLGIPISECGNKGRRHVWCGLQLGLSEAGYIIVSTRWVHFRCTRSRNASLVLKNIEPEREREPFLSFTNLALPEKTAALTALLFAYRDIANEMLEPKCRRERPSVKHKCCVTRRELKHINSVHTATKEQMCATCKNQDEYWKKKRIFDGKQSWERFDTVSNEASCATGFWLPKTRLACEEIKKSIVFTGDGLILQYISWELPNKVQVVSFIQLDSCRSRLIFDEFEKAIKKSHNWKAGKSDRGKDFQIQFVL